MKAVYSVLIKQDEDDYLVYVPDIDAMTQGKDFYEAIVMARDLLGTHSLVHELPKPSPYEQAREIAKNKADDEGFTFSDGLLTFVDIDTIKYRHKLNSR